MAAPTFPRGNSEAREVTKQLVTSADLLLHYCSNNLAFVKLKFHRLVQDSSEAEEEFVTTLQIIAHDCDFKDPEEMIRDRIVFGTNVFKVREKLITN